MVVSTILVVVALKRCFHNSLEVVVVVVAVAINISTLILVVVEVGGI